jgi:hypothetical protein
MILIGASNFHAKSFNMNEKVERNALNNVFKIPLKAITIHTYRVLIHNEELDYDIMYTYRGVNS